MWARAARFRVLHVHCDQAEQEAKAWDAARRAPCMLVRSSGCMYAEALPREDE